MSLVIKTIFWVRIRYEYSYQKGGFYIAIAKEQLRQIIKENNIQNVGDIYNLLQVSFKDMMQEMLEVKMVSLNLGANESSKFWLGMQNDLKNCGVLDVLFFCVDGLSGFKEAINSVYPMAQVQRCIIHMLRNSFKYVSYKDIKRFASDFKAVYKAPNKKLASSELESLKDIWGKKYPYAINNWEANWDVISPYFHFSEDIRRIMYTTNIIEGLNRQFRKVTKTKSSFTNDTSFEKMLYLASINMIKKWVQRYRNWDIVL